MMDRDHNTQRYSENSIQEVGGKILINFAGKNKAKHRIHETRMCCNRKESSENKTWQKK